MLTPGPTTPVDSSMSAVDLFCRFFTDEVWDLIVFETNRFAATQVTLLLLMFDLGMTLPLKKLKLL